MVNHPNRSTRAVTGTPRNAYPGDQVYIMLGAHTDAEGIEYETGTEYVPISGGVDNTTPGAHTYQSVTIGGRAVTFYGLAGRTPTGHGT